MLRWSKWTPLHGWRAFWGEVGIIVLGVLIALGAQQLAEGRAERQQARQAIAALRPETGILDFYAVEMELAAPCVIAQLDAIKARLLDGDRRALPLYQEDGYNLGFVVRIPSRPWPNTVWQGVNADGILRSIDPQRSRYLSSFYQQIEPMQTLNEAAVDDIASLRAMASAMPETQSDRFRLIETIERLKGRVDDMDVVAGQLRNSLAAARMPSDATNTRRYLADSGTLKFCRAHGLPIGTLRPADAAAASD